MGRMMRDIMGLHYGVLMYSRLFDEDGKSPVVVARGNFLREQCSKYPDRASVLDARIAGNERLQAALADPAEIARHVDEARLPGWPDRRCSFPKAVVSDDNYTLADTFATAALARFRLQGLRNGGQTAPIQTWQTTTGACESAPVGLRPASSILGPKAISRSCHSSKNRTHTRCSPEDLEEAFNASPSTSNR